MTIEEVYFILFEVSEDTAPTTSAIGTSPASVESSHETHSDSLINTVILQLPKKVKVIICVVNAS